MTRTQWTVEQAQMLMNTIDDALTSLNKGDLGAVNQALCDMQAAADEIKSEHEKTNKRRKYKHV